MTDWTNIRRMITAGAKQFARGGSVTAATVVVMTVTLGIIGALIFLSAMLTNVLGGIKDKVDVNVYFVTTASEDEIQDLIAKVKQLPEVESVTYTNRDQALDQFRERHSTDQLKLQALDELGANPFDASIGIKAKDPSQYGVIVQFLGGDPALSSGGTSIIDDINYYQNKDTIDRLTGAIRTTERAGLVVVILFAIASILIAFATIRLAIYSSRDEIGVMRLVGASNTYIRGPFITAGVMAGLLAALMVLLILFPVTFYAGNALQSWLSGFNLFIYYVGNFAFIFLLLVGSGCLLGGVASWLAVRKYLKV